MNGDTRRGIAIGLFVLACCVTWGFAQETPPPSPPQPTAPPAAPAMPAAPAAAAAPMVEQVNLVCDGKATSDGKIQFVVAPQGGAAQTVSVTLQKGMPKQDVCRDLAKEIRVALGAKYKVEQYDDDKVKIEGKEHAQFSLSIGAITGTGASVRVK